MKNRQHTPDAPQVFEVDGHFYATADEAVEAISKYFSDNFDALPLEQTTPAENDGVK